ncbi:MAG: hypothetical protein FJ098_04440 [Deltaproteobacteria bacterium]|nr:hypothetical protein [Deltaproteobacteria bacterium]
MGFTLLSGIAAARGCEYTHALRADGKGTVPLWPWEEAGLPLFLKEVGLQQWLDHPSALNSECLLLANGGLRLPTGPPVLTFLRDRSRTERDSHRFSSEQPEGLSQIEPVAPDTPAQQAVLRRWHGTRLARVHCPLFWDDPFQGLGKKAHKMLLALFYGGSLGLFEVPGNLLGAYQESRIGARAGVHWLLSRTCY